MPRSRAMQSPRRVLIVEDDVIVGILLEDLVATAGLTPSLAINVGDAEALLARFEFDGAILDFKLGEDSAVALGERLSEANIPHFFCSGAVPSDVRAALGDDAIVVAKPFEDEQIFEALRLIAPNASYSRAAE